MTLPTPSEEPDKRVMQVITNVEPEDGSLKLSKPATIRSGCGLVIENLTDDSIGARKIDATQPLILEQQSSEVLGSPKSCVYTTSDTFQQSRCSMVFTVHAVLLGKGVYKAREIEQASAAFCYQLAGHFTHFDLGDCRDEPLALQFDYRDWARNFVLCIQHTPQGRRMVLAAAAVVVTPPPDVINVCHLVYEGVRYG